MANFVHQAYIGCQVSCTQGGMESLTPVLHHMHMGKKVTPRPKVTLRPTYIRQWREYRGLTLEALADRVGEQIGGFTHASLSRIERGLQPYSQPVLEAIADALMTDPASLLMRNPEDQDAIWSLWERAQPGERRIIHDLAKSLTKTGTED